MQGMQFLPPEMCPETYMQGMYGPRHRVEQRVARGLPPLRFMPYWQQMGMDGQMPCMDGSSEP